MCSTIKSNLMAGRINYWQPLEEHVTYHFYNRAVGRDNLFITNRNYGYFLSRWKRYMPYLKVYAYCLMPNHFHFLAKVPPLDGDLWEHVEKQKTKKAAAFLENRITYNTYLEDQFKRLFSGYTLAINKQERRHGALFQKRFKRVAITSEYRLMYLLAYIHHKPIHHGLCNNYEAWSHSSYRSYSKMQKHSMLQCDEVLSWFSDDVEKAAALFHQYHLNFKIDFDLSQYAGVA